MGSRSSRPRSRARRSHPPRTARTRTAGTRTSGRTHAHIREHARTLTHSTDRNDAPGLAYLALTGFFKPVAYAKSLSAHTPSAR